ncbi:MAG: hypothetical protein ICV79_24180 [Flavisolibacter sp.]|nr:hypothetical protein [Flavisolibacter sp.]
MKLTPCLPTLVLLIVLYGCDKIGFCHPEKWNHTFAPAKRIDTTPAARMDTVYDYYQYAIRDGDKMVFTQTYQFRDCPNIADDEGSRMLLFEAPLNNDNFKIEGATALRQAKAIVSYSCECYPVGPVLLKEGTIEGTKLSDKRWQIKASVKASASDSRTLTFDHVFMRED